MASTSGPPNIMDTERGRRAGTLEDFCQLMKLCQSFEVIHFLGGATEPKDIPVNVRHLHVTRAQLMLCDKIPFIFSRGHGQIADSLMAGLLVVDAGGRTTWGTWTRDDATLTVQPTAGDWDSDMLCYPNVFGCDRRVYLLYNGNAFGRHGFGAAILER
jgi:hypothetical protein